MAGPKRRTAPGRRRRGGGVRPDDAILGGVGGFALVYFILVPHGFAHPWHWVASGAGGLVGAVAIWLWAERERVRAWAGQLFGRRRPGDAPDGGGRRLRP